jgi:hypothetical protein
VEFGFLEPVDAGWRVRGAGRYLRITESRKKGAAATNRKRWGGDVTNPNATIDLSLIGRLSDTGATPERQASDDSLSLKVALTPNTEHPSPIIISETKTTNTNDDFLWAQSERETVHGWIAELDLDPPGNKAFIEEVQTLTKSRFKPTYAAFLFDAFWIKNRCKWASFKKMWRDFVPPETPQVALPTCKTCGTTERLNGGWCIPCVASFQESAKAEPVAA